MFFFLRWNRKNTKLPLKWRPLFNKLSFPYFVIVKSSQRFGKGRLKSAWKVFEAKSHIFFILKAFIVVMAQKKIWDSKMQLPSFCTVYHNYNWVMTREKMNDTIKQPFFEWKKYSSFSLFYGFENSNSKHCKILLRC